MVYILACDGAARNNGKGVGAWAFRVYRDGEFLYGNSCISNGVTSNFNEYSALIEGLRWCAGNDIDELVVLQDSQLVSRQMTGEYAVKNESMKQLNAKANFLAMIFDYIEFRWVPRENEMVKKCDAECNRLMNSLKAG